MKKITLLLLFCILTTGTNVKAKDYTLMCSSANAKKSFGGTIMSISGINSITRNAVEYAIQKELKKETNSKFNVKIKNFYGNNLAKGEFNSLIVKSKQAAFDDIYFSDILAQTICDYNKVSYNNKKITFDENLILKYSANITQDDLNKTVESGKYKKTIDRMNSDKIISSLFKIQNSNIKIKKDRLVFVYEILPLPKVDILSNFIKTKTIKLTFGANLRADEGKLELCDFDFNSIPAKYSYLLPVINMLNPLSYGFKLEDSQKGKLDIESIQIDKNNISLSGFLVINKTK